MFSTALINFNALKAIAQTHGKQIFSILHTNDMHSNVVGVGPLQDYTPLSLGDDQTKGGYSRLGALITERKAELKQLGPVLVLDAGDFSMGTAVAAACRELGAELQLMGRMGYDATTFGNHEFDLGPDGLGKAIEQSTMAGTIPAVLAANSDFSVDSERLKVLQELAKAGTIEPYKIIERGGIRFGLLGLIGYDAFRYAIDPGGVVFADPIETAKSLAQKLKQEERVDIAIALHHGGVSKGSSGKFDAGEDINLLKTIPELDLVIGGHTHTELHEPLLVDNRPVVQTGKYGENLGELILSLENGRVQVESYRLIPIDDRIKGDENIQAQVENFLRKSGTAVFASRGYKTKQPLVVVSEDWPMNYPDIESGTPLANVVSDALRQATGSQIALTANGLIRAGLIKGNSGGVQTVYDVFAIAPLGGGVVDPTAGSALLKGYFTAAELKNILEFFLVDDPHHPGEYFPRVSGLRFYYDPNRPRFDRVTALELGNIDDGYQEIALDFPTLYSFTTSLFGGTIIAAIPKLSKGALPLQPKKADGTPINTRTDAVADPRESTSPYVLPANANLDNSMAATDNANKEIKEWQAIMDYFVGLPLKNAAGISILEKNERTREVRAIKI
ncbi:bifunctional UDP-sugar hydrolase/5'-nucleotidase [Myxosarcina sp. GI1]|uniref:bifunctional metallophosphatase/5'-nucleotidase n=1 Tax=Myxosarcina sp. GI1 TaxID=1541065 RepID=UPI00068C0081|nr:metallophosphoesterase [Myxosarcina sp. GI1]